MAGVFTIYCHGTGMSRDKKQDKEIVNFFGHTGDEEGVNQLMLDGVGEAPRNHPMAGSFVFDPTAPYNKRDISKDENFLKKNPLLAQIVGHGVDGNVKFAMAYLAALPRPPSTINLLGWSRGAVTALRLANAISRQWNGIDLNIFAVDPVAGRDKGESTEDAKTVPAQVRNLLVILATGEKRSTFSPQDAARLSATPASNVVLLPMPGAHDTVAMWEERTLHVSEVVFSMAGQFLSKFGTRPQRTKPMLSDAQYVERYSHMLLHLEEYKSLRVGKVKGATLKDRLASIPMLHTRDFAKKLDEYVVDPENFINLHHRRCFKSVYPNLFTYLYKANQSKLDDSKVEQEFAQVDDSTRQVLFKLAIAQMEKRNEPIGPNLSLYKGAIDKKRENTIKFRGSLHQMGVLSGNDVKQES